MKATIENFIQYNSNISIKELLLQFNDILEVINESENERELTNGISKLFTTYYLNFSYGFGSSHMWVKQDGVSERLLIVNF
jgi:hypothetical protein